MIYDILIMIIKTMIIILLLIIYTVDIYTHTYLYTCIYVYVYIYVYTYDTNIPMKSFFQVNIPPFQSPSKIGTSGEHLGRGYDLTEASLEVPSFSVTARCKTKALTGQTPKALPCTQERRVRWPKMGRWVGFPKMGSS